MHFTLTLRGKTAFYVGLLFFGDILAEQASFVTQYGITWTFDKPYTVGKYVNGDLEVVGPATVVKVDPSPHNGLNSSMVLLCRAKHWQLP